MKLKYVELPTKQIFNWLDPFNVTVKWACKHITGDWWSPENVKIRRYFADVWTNKYDQLTEHFTNLEASIKEKGILTPIMTESGPPRGTYLKPFHYPPEDQDDLTQAIHTHIFGGSRLTIANKLGIEKIACVVYDYANMFPDAVQVTESNYQDWFDDDYVFVENMFNTAPPQIRCIRMDGSTRIAQQAAAEFAQSKTYEKFGL